MDDEYDDMGEHQVPIGEKYAQMMQLAETENDLEPMLEDYIKGDKFL